MHKNLINVKIPIMVWYCRNPAFEFPRKNKLGTKKKEPRKQINQIIWYSSTATESIFILEFIPFQVEVLGQRQRNLHRKGPSLRDEQT